MKKSLQSFVLLLMAFMVPMTVNANYVKLADGVYQDGYALYISSSVVSLESLRVNPSVIYSYSQIPPSCLSNTFAGYNATLHVPASAMVAYFMAQYWSNFSNVIGDAIELQSITVSTDSADVELGGQITLSANILPSDATVGNIYWTSSNTSVATVSSNGIVTAIGVGECDIIASCVDMQAVCHVEVYSNNIIITLDKHEARLLPNHLLTINATCSPVPADLVVTSSDSTVALPRLINGTIQVIGVSEGSATITVDSADDYSIPDSCVVTVYTEVGDLNCDGYINISDVTALIDFLLSGNEAQISTSNADVNRSNSVNISDVTALIDFLLSGEWQPLTITVNGVSFKMMPVECGTFTMGATPEQGSSTSSTEKPAHQVTLTNSYFIGQTEVTQALWQAVMGSNPSRFRDDLNKPVEQVSWNNCQTFILKLNEMTGKSFRMLTEAEWEFAARGGNKSKAYRYAGSNIIGDVAWYNANAGSGVGEDSPDYGTHPVAAKAPNELGLYDMTGNVSEWCQDWQAGYSGIPQTNPTGPATGVAKVIRGGSWSTDAYYSRITARTNFVYPSTTSTNIGFRLAL